MVEVDVEYPVLASNTPISSEYLSLALRETRRNLEVGVALEEELGGFALNAVAPIELDQDLAGKAKTGSDSIAGPLRVFVDLFSRLVEIDTGAAMREFLSFRTDDSSVFARLRIWVCGKEGLVSGTDAGVYIGELTDKVFWDRSHQRDLLLVVARRWNDFPAA